MEIMWLGAGRLLQQVDMSTIPVLSSTVKVVQSARDLGVILDSQMSLSESHCCPLSSWFLSAPTNYLVTYF